jgi:hypothetical protein
MGTAVTTGPLTYTADESEWHESLNSSKGPRLPTNRFLFIHVSITNASGEEHGAPLLELVNPQGQAFQEVSEGDGVPEWMGYLRLLQAHETRSGRLLFDVPPGSYQLRVAGGGDPETEQTALIDIPFQLTPETPPPTTLPAFSGNWNPAVPAQK